MSERNQVIEIRECCNAECGWFGVTRRMLGAIGPLCPDCGEVTEPIGGPVGTRSKCDDGESTDRAEQ